ncbi:hypothetical protein ABW19_dt0200111 [Dactylella cylindrospora]|nr:hypothetical protein ABW19_dt0200111 [Dactylella cylindrospora]
MKSWLAEVRIELFKNAAETLDFLVARNKTHEAHQVMNALSLAKAKHRDDSWHQIFASNDPMSALDIAELLEGDSQYLIPAMRMDTTSGMSLKWVKILFRAIKDIDQGELTDSLLDLVFGLLPSAEDQLQEFCIRLNERFSVEYWSPGKFNPLATLMAGILFQNGQKRLRVWQEKTRFEFQFASSLDALNRNCFHQYPVLSLENQHFVNPGLARAQDIYGSTPLAVAITEVRERPLVERIYELAPLALSTSGWFKTENFSTLHCNGFLPEILRLDALQISCITDNDNEESGEDSSLWNFFKTLDPIQRNQVDLALLPVWSRNQIPGTWSILDLEYPGFTDITRYNFKELTTIHLVTWTGYGDRFAEILEIHRKHQRYPIPWNILEELLLLASCTANPDMGITKLLVEEYRRHGRRFSQGFFSLACGNTSLAAMTLFIRFAPMADCGWYPKQMVVMDNMPDSPIYHPLDHVIHRVYTTAKRLGQSGYTNKGLADAIGILDILLDDTSIQNSARFYYHPIWDKIIGADRETLKDNLSFISWHKLLDVLL